MSYGKRLLFDPIRELGFNSIVANYTACGDPFDHPIRILVINNTTDRSVFISLNGSDEHLLVPANGNMLFDITSNSIAQDAFFMSKGTQVYVKRVSPGVAPTYGSVYVSVGYSSGD